MITIEQLLESVDLDFEPRWVTKNKNGSIDIWDKQPKRAMCIWNEPEEPYSQQCIIPHIKLADFADKPWQECIYEVPRKAVISKMEKIEKLNLLNDSALLWGKKINDLVEAVNEINENYACIAALTDIRKRLDTLEKCVKNKRGEE